MSDHRSTSPAEDDSDSNSASAPKLWSASLPAVQQDTEARLIRAELKAEAMRAGMIDIDGLKLIDLLVGQAQRTW